MPPPLLKYATLLLIGVLLCGCDPSPDELESVASHHDGVSLSAFRGCAAAEMTARRSLQTARGEISADDRKRVLAVIERCRPVVDTLDRSPDQRQRWEACIVGYGQTLDIHELFLIGLPVEAGALTLAKAAEVLSECRSTVGEAPIPSTGED